MKACLNLKNLPFMMCNFLPQIARNLVEKLKAAQARYRCWKYCPSKKLDLPADAPSPSLVLRLFPELVNVHEFEVSPRAAL
jgi:hypothetical protein